LLCVGMLIAIVVCYLAEILMPGWVPVIEEHAGSWNGVFPHKNILARMMVLAVLAFLCFRPRHAFGRWIRGGGISASLGLIVLSRSATGILMMSALLCCYFIFRCTRLRGRQFILLLAGSIALLVMGSLFLVNYSDALLRVVGRDSSWSGRTVLWKVSLLSIAKRPLLGYGFHAFWRENNESLTARSLLTNHWDAPHAHNGFIETLLQLGIIGLVLISLSLVTLLFRAFRRYRSSGASEDLWPIMLVLFLVFYNLTESSMMVENAVTWILFIAAAFRLTFEQGTHYQLPLNSPILSQSVRQDNPLGGLAS
jgi:exopolysaccharide production protein ExoQ